MGTATRQESPSVRSDGRPRDCGNLIGPRTGGPMSSAAVAGLMNRGLKGGLILVAPDHSPKMIRLVVDGAGLPALCDRVRVEIDDGHPDVVVFELSALISPDLRTVDALARAR